MTSRVQSAVHRGRTSRVVHNPGTLDRAPTTGTRTFAHVIKHSTHLRGIHRGAWLLSFVLVLLAGCSLHSSNPRPPAALRAVASEAAAADVAVYVLQLYSLQITDRRFDPDPSLAWTQCWECSSEADVVNMMSTYGGGTSGGGLRDISVASSTEASGDRYEVELTARRDPWRFRDVHGRVIGEEPERRMKSVVTLTHTGAGWRVDRLVLEIVHDEGAD